MSETHLEIQHPASIEQLSLRGGTLLGHSGRFANRKIVQTGYEQLDSGLLNGGMAIHCRACAGYDSATAKSFNQIS